MAVEVIDLLSSPGASEPAQAAAAAKSASATRQHAAAEALSSDLYNLTEDTPIQLQRRRGSLNELPPISQIGASTSRIATAYDVYFTSDDFRSTGELGGGSVDDEPRATKRRRLSKVSTRPAASPVASEAEVGATAQLPGVLSGQQKKFDSILFTSSPGAATHVRNTAPETVPLDDPFATSPPKGGFPSPKVIETNTLGRLDSDPFKSTPVRPKAKSPRKTRDWDPISSSAPEIEASGRASRGLRTTTLGRSRSEVIELCDSDDGDDAPKASSDSEFPELGSVDVSRLRAQGLAARYSAPQAEEPIIRRNGGSRSTGASNKDPTPKDKQVQAAAREAEKERKKKEKELAKEQRMIEKERIAALAEVNKVRTDKKVSSPEMIVDISSTLTPTIKLQVEQLLTDISVKSNPWAAPVDSTIKWRRKVSSRFNDELGHWEPISMRVQEEKHVMVVVQAPEFVKLVLADEGEDLEAHVLRMQRHFKGCTVVYLIEGLTSWLRKNRNVRNRQFVSAVRSNGDDAPAAAPPSSQPARRRKKDQPQEYIDEDSIEDALLNLQVLHGALIHHTTSTVETAQWITIFTQHISTIPYRRQKEQFNDTAAFCMETGQVRTGDGAKDTYVRMLQEIARVTAPIAYGIAAEFDSVSGLVEGLEEGGPLRLEACRKSANRDGAFSDRNIGQAVSKRIYKVFTGRDETSTDI